MGAAKRRGTFEQRKAQRISKQYGMTNDEVEEAYAMNISRSYKDYLDRFRRSTPGNQIDGLFEYIIAGGRIF